jgi:hypothetical protein
MSTYTVQRERGWKKNDPKPRKPGEKQRKSDKKQRGPFWFLLEDGHEVWWNLNKQVVEREADWLNSLTTR